jgi:pyruvate dehydrogenase E1 component alpha subunit
VTREESTTRWQADPEHGGQPPLLRYLDEDGELVGGEQPMSDEQALAGLRTMLTARRFDERCISLQRQGRMVTLAPGIGQEAATAGAAMALDRGTDWFVPQYREIAGQFWHGYPLKLAFLWHMGHPLGFKVPDEVRMLPFQAAIAGQLPQAAGMAWGLALKGEPSVVLAVFGEGGTSQGDFHEAANLAGVIKAPLILLCQNNNWAISTPYEKQTAATTVAQKAIAYGMPGVRADGNDLFAMYAATRTAVERARRGEGPTLIEAVTYRLGLHTTADDPTRYEPAEMHDLWVPRDPLRRLRIYLESTGALAKDGFEQLEAEVREALSAGWEEAQQEPPPDPQHYFRLVETNTSPRLERQLRALGQSHRG